MGQRLVALLLLTLIASTARAAGLTVLAAASLTESMKEISAKYEARGGDRIVLSFSGSNTLARQIREGAPADLFFSADAEQIDALIRKKLVDAKTRTELLSNQLVVVVPAEDRRAVRDLNALTESRFRTIALANPDAVPAGVYARKLLVARKLWSSLQSHIVRTENVRGALAAVESGNADAAIVYRTDVIAAKNSRIAYEVPRSETPEIMYVAAVVRSSKQKVAAARFLAFLRSREVAEIFRKYGFVTLR